ncbi:MAG: hypothetical protein IJX02_03545 [Clostridia bacterium]|nr:hypothetical protein [Clostridia bacterium]
MSKYTVSELWDEFIGEDVVEAEDEAGRIFKKSAINNPNSRYHPTIDHIRPLSNGGKDVKENISICNRITNQEKGNKWPHWKTNGRHFHGEKIKYTQNGYRKIEDI